jgi:hypothetical protein
MVALRWLSAIAFIVCAVPAWALNPQGAPADHFLCYKTKNSPTDICQDTAPNEGAVCTGDATCGAVPGSCVKNKRAKFSTTLDDSIDGAVLTTAIKTNGLCLPVDKNFEGVTDDATHLVSIKIKNDTSVPKHVPTTNLAVSNQFGVVSIDTIKEDRLLVPAAKNLSMPVAPPLESSHAVDRFKCYKVKVTKQTPRFLGTTVSLNDQFTAPEGGDKDFQIKKPKRLCVPVSVNGSTIKRASGDLLCYKAKLATKLNGMPIVQPPHTPRTTVHVNSELGPEHLDTTKPAELCVPSVVLDPDCEILNDAECLLPYPSNRFTVADPSTDTGLRLDLPAKGVPKVNGPAVDPSPINAVDGFSPTSQILMHFPQGVDLQLSDTARLLAPGCCGQPAGPPWIDTRTYDGRSLDSDSPSVLMKAGSGERILHWLELDARATTTPRRALVLRPGVALEPATRYIVAIRGLKTPTGATVQPEAAFAALRDGTGVGIAAIDARRPQLESIFTTLAANGVDRDDLQLAFDFTTQSDDQLTRQMISMRDQAYAWLATVQANPMQVPFTVTSTTTNTCNPGQVVWRTVRGTFQSPLFLTADPIDTNVPQHSVDGNDVPVQNGFMNPQFDISIPCSVFNPMVTSRPLILGHGLFGNGASMVSGIPPAAGQVVDWTYIAGATDWRGLSQQDFLWVGVQIVGFGTSALNNFPAFPDRLRQGMLNTLVLARMMKLGLFNRHVAFEQSPGVGVFPGASEEMYYYGISLGGIMGTWFSALTPDIERFGVDVPAVNFSCLLQRSTQFSLFDTLLISIGLTDPMQTLLGLQLLHELWVSAEPAGYVRHITSDPLPGSGAAKNLLMTVAWLDKQVSNQCTEAAARTLGLANLTPGSLQAQLQGIPDQAGPLDSAYVMYNTGSFDLFNPAHQPFIPPLANLIPSTKCDPHGARPAIPAGVEQLYNFLQPGGQVVNFCNGICDAGDPTETANGNPPCDPLL